MTVQGHTSQDSCFVSVFLYHAGNLSFDHLECLELGVTFLDQVFLLVDEDAGWMGDAYTNTYIDENGNEIVEEYAANRWGHRAQMCRCKSIGDIPDSLINGGNAAVVNGDTVYDPTPNN